MSEGDADRARAVVAAFNNHFEAEPDLVVRAPGRNTAIGDHLDYPPLPQGGAAGSRTIAWASRRNVLAAGRRRPDQAIKLVSTNHAQQFTISLDDLDGLAHEAAQDNLHDVYGQETYPWAMNVLALLYSARHGRHGVRSGLPLCGVDLLFEGNVPMGAGQASSAAFLVAVTLACNELCGWRIPRDDLFTLADLARSGEHEDYTPFIRKGRAGYLDQVASLAAVEGKAVVIDHGDYRAVRLADLDRVEAAGYANAVVSSGLSRSLAETDYGSRVGELSRLPALLNSILERRRPSWRRKAHVHEFTQDEWREAADELARADPTLARRARYVFEEQDRTARFVAALERGDIAELVALVNASGEAMSMTGPYQVSGYNQVPAVPQRVAALDLLREIVLRHAGPGAAARMMGGGGAGPLYLLLPAARLDDLAFHQAVADEWRRRTGLAASITRDPPAAGAGIVWRRAPATVVASSGASRIETYQDIDGRDVYRLVAGSAHTCAEVVPARAAVRALYTEVGGATAAVLFNAEGPADDPATTGWQVVEARVDEHGATELRCAQGDAAMTYSLEGRRLTITSERPAAAALHPWILLHSAKHQYAEVRTSGNGRPVAEVNDWFRDLHVRVGAVSGFEEIVVSKPAGLNAVRLELRPGDAVREAAMYIEARQLSRCGVACRFAAEPAPARRPTTGRFPRLVKNGMDTGPLAEPGETATHKDAVRVFYRGRWHIYGTGHEMKDPANPPPGHRPHRGSIMFHLVAERLEGPYQELHPPVLLGQFPRGIYEAPSLVAEDDTLHLFAQTTYYRLGGTIEHFVSTDGQHFSWQGTALRSLPGGQQAGIYDADVAVLPLGGRDTATMLYSGFSREGGRHDRPDPVLFLGVSESGLAGPYRHGDKPLLTDANVPWHNSHDPANPFYEWGLEGAQLLPMRDGSWLLLSVAFEKRPGRDYMPAQRLLFATYNPDLTLREVSDPILPLANGWDEYGHGSMMVDPEEPGRLRLLFQARPRNDDGAFRDSNTWRLFEATFEI